MCEQNCFNCARRKGFFCYGLQEKKIDIKGHAYGTMIAVKNEDDLNKLGEKCIMFKSKVWSVS